MAQQNREKVSKWFSNYRGRNNKVIGNQAIESSFLSLFKCWIASKTVSKEKAEKIGLSKD